MSNINSIIFTFIVTISLVLFFYRVLYLRKKKHSVLLKPDFEKFRRAIENKNLEEINYYGEKLIFNTSLTGSKLKEISLLVKQLELESYNLKSLRLLIYNKSLDWNKEYH